MVKRVVIVQGQKYEIRTGITCTTAPPPNDDIPIRNAAGAHGSVIGIIKPGWSIQCLFQLEPPIETPHDNWVLVWGPRPIPVRDDGCWTTTQYQGWIELPHVDFGGGGNPGDTRKFEVTVPPPGEGEPTIRETT